MRILKGIRFSFLLFIIALFSSCEMLSKDTVAEFFDYYTNSAEIAERAIIDSIGTSSNGIECIESNDAKTIVFTLRNPKNYTLEFSYSFDNADIQEYVNSHPGAVQFVQSSDRKQVQLIFGKTFLNHVDMGNFTDPLTTAVTKNLSGIISIRENESQRQFNSYHLPVMANSAPLAVKNAMLQLAGNGSGNYILCFHAPVTTGTIHKDINEIIINGESYTYNSNGSATDSNTPSLFSSSRTVYPLQSGGFQFSTTAPTSYTPLYYDTGIDMAANGADEVRFSITLRDASGLSTTS